MIAENGSNLIWNIRSSGIIYYFVKYDCNVVRARLLLNLF